MRAYVLCVLCLVLRAHARPTDCEPQPERIPFELEDVIMGKFMAKGFNGTWVSDSSFVYKTDDGNLKIFDLKKMAPTHLVNVEDIRDALCHKKDSGNLTVDHQSKQLDELKLAKCRHCKHNATAQNVSLKDFNITAYSVSPNHKFVLFKKDSVQGFRYSSLFKCFIYSIETKEVVYVARDMQLQLIRWVPKSSGLIYVRDNNVYYRTGPGKVDRELQLTTDGIPGVKYNGVTDWVYEEEMFGSGAALWLSQDGAWLAIASFDDSNVDEVMYFHYGESGTLESQNPELIELRYPKAGRVNPLVKVKALRLLEAKCRSVNWITLQAPLSVVGADHLLADVHWATNRELAVTWVNRRQNVAAMQICQAISGLCKVELKTEEPRGWIEVTSPCFFADGNYAVIRSVKQFDGLSWPQLCIAERGCDPKPITFGNRTVLSILGIDPVRENVFYSTTTEETGAQREVHVAGAKNYSLTQQLLTEDGLPCHHGGASFSKDFSYAVLSCSGPSPPTVVIYDIMKEESVITWEDNGQLKAELTKYKEPTVRDLTVDVPNGFQADVRLFIPEDYNPEDCTTTYPMIVGVYAGPAFKKIVDIYKFGYFKYISTNRNFVFAEIDARGSAYRSDEFLFEVNNVLGTIEIDDQILVTKKLTEMFPFIDATRVGVWGWSYGGYASAMLLIRDTENVFKCSASVAPVTSWLYYDSIFTERYMGLPTDNEEGYKEGDITLHAEGMRNKGFLLLHGIEDDNVHYQNTVQLIRQLELLDIPFECHTYPNEAHDLKSVRAHVYHAIDHFWTTCFHMKNKTKVKPLANLKPFGAD